ncbi:hydrocephalus-inducing protein homolog [Passer domesticus]|uniref:hydrocephalus-inducing protein homolog n=1 Tax=Passer domesticus TaxID=48849 RepID=UPI0030FF074A
MSLLQIPRLVKVCMETCPYFQLASPRGVYHMVPAGASAAVRIRFSPEENKDYSHQLICMTTSERIVVPIRAIAARAVLDFPEQLDFSRCPVKSSTQKTLLLRNTGNLEARFQLSTQSPFSVAPAAGALGAGDTVQVTVGFHALTAGDHCGCLAVCCSTGEERIHTHLKGEAVDVNVGLSTSSVEMDKTLITMSSHRTVFIQNRSNITAHFQWKAFPSEEGEDEEKRRQCLLQTPKEVSEENITEEKSTEEVKGFGGGDTALLSSMVQEEMAKVPEEPMLFSNEVFFIEPMEGEIGPNCSAEIQVTFKPLAALEYGSVAYCSISGRESRLPLQLRGEGQGPLVELSCDTLELGDIFVNTPHVCEVNLINQGALDAPFRYIPSATKVGLGFKLAPQEGIIAAGGSQTLQISFSATVLGRFEEEFRFSVAGSPTPAILTIKGSVTGPSLHFDLPELDFGDISFGFPYTQCCRLTNSSPVPVTFQLRMSFDGTQPAVDSVDQIRCHSDPAWRKGVHLYVEPREFTITPSQGTILPQGHQDIQVTLCSNSVMEFYRKMLVDLEGFGKGVASLVITARCLVPKLQVSPHVLQYDECLLKVPYEKKFIIRNPSHLPGCYGLIEQKRKEDSAVLYSSPKPCGIVQPHSTAEIPVLVEVQALGTHRTNVLIGVFGDERNPLASSILPVSGVLQPGESQQVSLPFSGHLNSISSATALCHVEGGPSSEVLVPGEASRVSCSPSPQEINCGSGAPLRERRELKRLSPKLEEEAKALEEEERQKEKEKQKKEKKGVSNEMHVFCYEYEETA